MIQRALNLVLPLILQFAAINAHADEPINCDPTHTKHRFVIFENASVELVSRSGYSVLAFQPEFPQEAYEQPEVPIGSNGQPLISAIKVHLSGNDCMAAAYAVDVRRGETWTRLRPGRTNEFNPHYFGERFSAEEVRVATKLRLVESTECQIKIEALIQADIPPFLTPTQPQDPRC
jgi:hypothetical protein